MKAKMIISNETAVIDWSGFDLKVVQAKLQFDREVAEMFAGLDEVCSRRAHDKAILDSIEKGAIK